MDDVESINVLKGPAATALYGSRGGAGAIIITTKPGKSEKGLLEVSHTLQAETYYNHFNMQKLYGGDGYGATEKGNRAQDIYELYTGNIPSLQGAYVYDYNEDTSWGAAYDPSVKWVYDRTYVKLREVSLSYVVPSQALKKLNIGLSRANVAVNASHPWLIYSAYPNVDASEMDMGYFEGGNAAATRSVGFTVNLAF